MDNVTNSIDAINRVVEELSNDDGTNTFQKMLFIRYSLHVAGDMHQPLHNVNFYNKTYSGSEGDIGGNKQHVIDLKNNSLYLHAYWDSGAEYLEDPVQTTIFRPFNKSTTFYFQKWGESLMQMYPREFYGEKL